MSVVKILPTAALGLAGAVLAVIAYRAPAQNYVPPAVADVAAHREAPRTLSGEIPRGSVLHGIEVRGMCCRGCTGRIYERLATTPGFVEAAVDFEEGIAHVVVSGGADPETFARALRFDKYDAKLRVP